VEFVRCCVVFRTMTQKRNIWEGDGGSGSKRVGVCVGSLSGRNESTTARLFSPAGELHVASIW